MLKNSQVIYAEKGLVRFSHEGKVRYGQLHGDLIRVMDGSPFSGGKPGAAMVGLDQVKLLAPCRPSKVVAVALNYKQHAKEMGRDLPTEPMLFLKPSTSVIGPGDYIVKPPMSKRVDHENELGVVISRKCSRVSQAAALDYVLGYTCLNDVTARDLQGTDIQFTRAKGFDTFCPLGPAIATDLDPSDLLVRAILNDDVKQKGRTSDLIFDVPFLVSFISQVMTLMPGDVIATGTPSGVGPMADGDLITIEVEKIGKLINPVKSRG